MIRRRGACGRHQHEPDRRRKTVRARSRAASARSGSSGQRSALDTASARSLPSLISGSSTDLALALTWMWLPSTSAMAGAAPL